MPQEENHHDEFEGQWWEYPILRNALLAGVLAGVGFVLAHSGFITEQVELAFYVVAIPLGGYHWAREAVEELVTEHEIGIDLLMLAATVGSGLLGLWDEAAFLVFLYGAAEGLEEYTYARTRSAIRALLDLAPKEAHLLREGQEVTIAAEALQSGDRFLVRPGESVPTDGLVKSGTSSLDESAVTGESIPVDKEPGMLVFAGTLNLQGALEVEATAAFQDNTLAKIIHLVEEAQERKGKTQQWIERFGRRYSPVVLGASLLFLLVPWLLGLPSGEWAVRAVVLLVAAAPCALVMSMPVAMAAGIGAAGRQGILIKGGAHLEHLGSIRTIAFDKTGTLTEGVPIVTDVIPFACSTDELLRLAAGVEYASAHPLARAIVDRARAQGVAPAEVRDFESLTGTGAKAIIGQTEWYVGKWDLFKNLGPKWEQQVERAAHQFQAQGKTVVLVGNGDAIHGLLALQDRIRPGMQDVIRELHTMGIQVSMLTGDHELAAQAVARELDIDDVRASLSPEEKVRAVQELERRFGGVLMVGDGINDAPALAAATCGMAMGAMGSDAAIEAADVALMSEDLRKVAHALRLGRKVSRISRQNIVFSLILLAILIPSALLGVMSVAAAVFIHEVSELLAVANGLRVRKPLQLSAS
ncbi:MAG: cadmium transporter ATPase [Nitrospirales bacterium]|nr:MAG: cadmium transporter ATPase [Nitrospirales bacterium]